MEVRPGLEGGPQPLHPAVARSLPAAQHLTNRCSTTSFTQITGHYPRTGRSKGEMRGSLHCAMDGEAVNCFGRDDDSFGGGWKRRDNSKGRSRSLQDEKQKDTQRQKAK